MPTPKKLFNTPLSALLGILWLSFSAYADHEKGWHIVNTTSTPLGVAWYGSDVRKEKAPFGLNNLLLKKEREVAYGDKTRLSEPVIIYSGDSYFISPVEGTDQRYQLVMTQSPALLRPILEADERGAPVLPGLYTYDKKTHPLLSRPFFKFLTTIPRLYVRQPKGTAKLLLQASRATITSESLTQDGWSIINKSDKPVYCAWYATSWDRKTKAFTDPVLKKDHSIITIKPGEKAPIVPPTEDKESSSLIFSFAYDALTKTIKRTSNTLPEEVKEQTFAHLDAYGTQWQVYNEERAPYLLAHNHLIQIINTTNNPLYCALYYVNCDDAIKCGPQVLVTKVMPQLTAELQYPPKNSKRKIQLFVSREDQKDLLYQKKLTKDQYMQLYTKSFSKTNLINWYLQGAFAIGRNTLNPLKLHVYSVGGGLLQRLARKAVSIDPLKALHTEKYEQKFREQDPTYVPDQDIKAAKGQYSVLDHPSEKHMEQEFTQKRSEQVRTAINKLLGKEYLKKGAKIPRIALVFTGGGYRAMIETLGFLQGADNGEGGNILDCCTYMMGLSGSTWTLMPLVASGLTPDQFAQQQKYAVGHGGIIPLKTLVSNLMHESIEYPQVRFIQGRYGQFHGPLGCYGHALAHALLDEHDLDEKDAHSVTLSDLRSKLSAGRYPLPICVAVDQGTHERERIWYEFSPYYCGTYQEQGSWIDTKLFGCTFMDGRPVHIVPEYPLAQYMGIWGSAFALSARDIAKESAVGGFITRSLAGLGSGFYTVYDLMLSETSQGFLSHGRATAGTFPNYNYLRKDAFEGIASKPLLHLVDGGITKEGDSRHNFASIPALWRNVDILIMCDSIRHPNNDRHSEHLLAADEEARRQRLAFPNISRSSKHNKVLKTMHKDVASLFIEDGAPAVVYIKAKQNKLYDEYLATTDSQYKRGFDPDTSQTRFTSTLNFSYTPEQFEVLSGLTKSIFMQSKDTIKKAIYSTVTKS